jgi:hypothetical protein
LYFLNPFCFQARIDVPSIKRQNITPPLGVNNAGGVKPCKIPVIRLEFKGDQFHKQLLKWEHKMKFTRRDFIAKLSVTAVAAASSGSAANAFGQTVSDGLFLPPPGSSSDALNYLTGKHFEPFINTAFSVRTGVRGRSTWILTEVNDLSLKVNQMRGHMGESFSLLFHGPAGNKLVPGICEFKHDALGNFSFLANQVGMDGQAYEVVVNRISL